MQNSINKEIFQDSRKTMKLKNLRAKKIMYFMNMIVSPVLYSPVLLVPVFGWFGYPLMITASAMLYANAKRLYQMQDYRWERIIIDDLDRGVPFMEDYYALVKDNKIVMIMDVVEIDKNKKLRDLLVAQHGKKNVLNNIRMTINEFKSFQGGRRIEI